MSKLRKFTQKEINKIIENHRHWLREDCEGWEDMRADLSYVDLRGADLSYANLSITDLSHANLENANLSNADLSHADLRNAELYNADLSNVNLYKANLSYADLSNADLRYAELSNANLKSANLENAKINYSLACPPKGSFTAWKKADGKIVKLQILEDSKRLSATTNKCRCDKALVLEIQDWRGNRLNIKSVRSDYDKDFAYKVGEIVEVEDFDDNRWNECSTGIHFFVDRQLAVDY